MTSVKTIYQSCPRHRGENRGRTLPSCCMGSVRLIHLARGRHQLGVLFDSGFEAQDSAAPRRAAKLAMSGSPPRKKPKSEDELMKELDLAKAKIASQENTIASQESTIASQESTIASQALQVSENEKLKEQLFKQSLKALVFGNFSLELTGHGSTSSHTGRTVKHLDAEMTEQATQLAPFEGAKFTERITGEDWMTASSLLRHFSGLQKHGACKPSYSNEADISSYVSSALQDAVYLASAVAGKRFYLRNEMSFFSQRPDHLVVVDPETGVPLIAVEDKKPFSRKLADEKWVLGQLFDYAVAMKAFGHATPFLILTTFQKSSMLWLCDSDSNDIANNVESILEDRFGQVLLPDGPSASGQTTKKTPSPPDLKQEPWKHCDEEEQQAGFQAASSRGERQLMGTREYDSTHLVPLMFTAILCGAAANPYTGTKIKNLDLEQGKWYELEALKMTSNEYTWGTLRAKIDSPVSNEVDSYYVVGIVGAGSTSKVFHALDAAGKECVIKMYTKRTDGLSKKKFENEAVAATGREVSRFDQLYPDMGVAAKTIYDHSCVVLPFFRPIQKAERTAHMSAIKKELERFANNGLRYATCDVRWRHVGLHNGSTVLFDLADLEALGKNDSVEGVVAQQENELKRRME